MNQWVRLAPALLLIAWLSSAAQDAARAEHNFEITPYYGYRLGGELEDIEFPNVDSLEIEDGSALGIIVSYSVHDNGQIEFQYSHQSTELKGNGDVFSSSNLVLTDLDVDWWLVGGNYTAGARRDPLRGFIGFSLGMTDLDPKEPAFDGDSLFAFSFYGGFKAALAERIGLRFQVQWVAALFDSENDAFCSSAGFCFLVTESQYLDQFELSAGMIIKI